MSNLNFGQALEALKQGKAVARSSWKNKQVCLTLKKGSRDVSNQSIDKLPKGSENVDGIPFYLFEQGDKGTFTRFPEINQFTATSKITIWTPSIADLLSEDWLVFDEELQH